MSIQKEKFSEKFLNIARGQNFMKKSRNFRQKPLTNAPLFDIIPMFSREWRNWQTRTFEGRVVIRTGSSPVSRTTNKKDGNSHPFCLLWLMQGLERRVLKTPRGVFPPWLFRRKEVPSRAPEKSTCFGKCFFQRNSPPASEIWLRHVK